jgi:7-keto-8-aminopelargonate synthetase-like enzyme
MSGGLEFLVEALGRLEREGRLRVPPTEGKARASFIDLASNDYLGLARCCPSMRGRRRCVGPGRRIPERTSAPKAFATWIGCQAALLFSSDTPPTSGFCPRSRALAI